MENAPEYIEGTPTNKHSVKERFVLIQSYYEKLWKKLQRETKSNYIRNEFLDAQIFIVKNESEFHGKTHHWSSCQHETHPI